MMLLMHQRRANLLIDLADKPIRVERQLMSSGFCQPSRKPISAEISKRMRFSLVRYKNVGQLAVEKLAVEMIISFLQAAVLNRRDRRVSRSFEPCHNCLLF